MSNEKYTAKQLVELALAGHFCMPDEIDHAIRKIARGWIIPPTANVDLGLWRGSIMAMSRMARSHTAACMNHLPGVSPIL